MLGIPAFHHINSVLSSDKRKGGEMDPDSTNLTPDTDPDTESSPNPDTTTEITDS